LNLADFHNRLRILRSIDADEFVAAAREVEDGASLRLPGAFQRFAAQPFDFFLRSDDQSVDALWRLIERRSERRAAR
jgi:hypothetical protein